MGLFFLFGCQNSDASLPPTPTVTSSPTVTILPTEIPTLTVTPLPEVGVLVAPPEADSRIVSAVQPIVAESVKTLGYRFQVRPRLSPDDFSREVIKFVVAVADFPDLSEIIASHPETRFLTIDIQGLNPTPNLTQIGGEMARLDRQGFVAGYMAALITADWRVGVIGLSSSEETLAARQAFLTGVKFYCGLCLPEYPPFFEYPLFFELSADADNSEWHAAAEFMIHRQVETVYVVPGAGDDAMLRHLAQSGVNLIGGTLPLADIQDHWIASLRSDPLLVFPETWSDFVAAENQRSVSVPLTLFDINSELLSPGKQRLVEEILFSVQSDYIDLGTNSTQIP